MSDPTSNARLTREDGRVVVVAEMANAHEGRLETALEIAAAAAEAGADALKVQVFTPDELAVPAYEHHALYHTLQMSPPAWAELVEAARGRGLKVLADVFGLDSLALMAGLGIDGYKIHVADVGNRPLLERVGAEAVPVLLSVGGSLWVETAAALATLTAAGAGEVVLMHGFQGYPCLLEDSHLRRLGTLRERFARPVGFASHVDGGTDDAVGLPLQAAAAGAALLEVHLTLDRGAEGLDYYSSLDPDRFAALVQRLRSLEPTLGSAALQLGERELTYRNAHKKFLVATREIAAGERLSAADVALKRVPQAPPGRPLGLDAALGRRASRRIAQHALIGPGDLQMKVAATLACRLESTRLYGKPMQLIGGKPIISHLIERLRRIEQLDEIVLAISDGSGQQVFVDYANAHGLPYVVGPEKDVLQRLIMAADHVGADIALRTTTENPYVYWENTDALISEHIAGNHDLSVTEKLPLGAFLEVISVAALKAAHAHGEDRHRSELCTLFIAENPDQFSIRRVPAPAALQHPEYRLTVDWPTDLLLVRALYDALHVEGELISIEQVVSYLDAHPDLAKSNLGDTKTLYLWA